MHKLGAGAEAIVIAKRFEAKSHKLHVQVLQVLAEVAPHFLTYDQIRERADLKHRVARRVTRYLKRYGLVEYSTLWDEYDGGVCGFGHAASQLGRVVYGLLEKPAQA